jgi:predicted esterase
MRLPLLAALLAVLAAASAACSSPVPTVTPPAAPGATNPVPAADAPEPAAEPVPAPDPPRAIGPFELPFDGKRTVYFAVPPSRGRHRVIANLHGLCNPPGYACGYWTAAGSERGFLVCPSGNSTCGPGAYNAPTWTEGDEAIDRDLERAVATVDGEYPGEMTREGAVLTGFSRGAYAAAHIASLHPGRWRYLLLTEADVPLDARTLRAAGVRAVALVAGEIGSQIAGERRTYERLKSQGFPVRLWVMPRAGHYYSANIDDIMREALDWLVRSDEAPDADAQ